ncbi:MAG TPA: alpha/beta hydrolase [Pseudonocardiaceae bacterium]|nr:alpha/beta hydrolase [Pseudonocardiaceae bacterium]
MYAIPGTMCAPSVFRRLAEELAGEVEVEAVSWLTEPGPWDIPTVADRIAERITEPALVLGHSTGGAIALQLALAHPDLVTGLILVNTGAHMRGHGDVDRILGAGFGPELRAAVLDRSFATPLDPADREELLAYAAGVPGEAALEVLRSQRDLDLTPRLTQLRCPVTIVHGWLDQVRTVEQANELAADIPGAHLRLVETGHTPVYEAPELVAGEVRALLT